jgi:hypothetical protein
VECSFYVHLECFGLIFHFSFKKNFKTIFIFELSFLKTVSCRLEIPWVSYMTLILIFDFVKTLFLFLCKLQFSELMKASFIEKLKIFKENMFKIFKCLHFSSRIQRKKDSFITVFDIFHRRSPQRRSLKTQKLSKIFKH